MGIVPTLYFGHVLKNKVEKLQEDNKKLEELLNDLIKKSNSPQCLRHSIDVEDLKKQILQLLGCEEETISRDMFSGMKELDRFIKPFKNLEGDDFIKYFMRNLGGTKGTAGADEGDVD